MAGASLDLDLVVPSPVVVERPLRMVVRERVPRQLAGYLELAIERGHFVAARGRGMGIRPFADGSRQSALETRASPADSNRVRTRCRGRPPPLVLPVHEPEISHPLRNGNSARVLEEPAAESGLDSE